MTELHQGYAYYTGQCYSVIKGTGKIKEEKRSEQRKHSHIACIQANLRTQDQKKNQSYQGFPMQGPTKVPGSRLAQLTLLRLNLNELHPCLGHGIGKLGHVSGHAAGQVF